MNKYQKRTVAFCLLTAASIMFGQAARTSFTYAPLIAFAAAIAFTFLASINAYKAYYENME